MNTIQNFEFPSLLLLDLFWKKKKTTDTTVNHNSSIQLDNIPDHCSGLLTELEIQILNYYFSAPIFSSFASLFNKDKFTLFKPASISPITVLFQGEKKGKKLIKPPIFYINDSRFWNLLLCFSCIFIKRTNTDYDESESHPPPPKKSHNRPLLFDFQSQNLNLR